MMNEELGMMRRWRGQLQAWWLAAFEHEEDEHEQDEAAAAFVGRVTMHDDPFVGAGVDVPAVFVVAVPWHGDKVP
jgi:hypothetical protein